MKSCSIVIGSGLGDEGKGHYADFLCQKEDTLNIRFNGGPQAAHTVVTSDGQRHVFRHFGAGTFAGAVTYLTEDFLVNPISYVFERNELIAKFGIYPEEIVNPNALVTTLWDMYINQAVEVYRDNDRHGSCGMGINETVERSQNSKYCLRVKDLIFENTLREKLKLLQDEYVEWRLKTAYGLNVSDLPGEYPKLLSSEENIDMFIFYAKEFLGKVKVHGDSIINCFDYLVFEGAQGLMLDQNNPDCSPDFLTTSNTGVKNAVRVLRGIGYREKVDVYYVSRCYATRHGAGPLSHEVAERPYRNVVDETNITNQFQGSLRFGYIDFDTLSRKISEDMVNLTIPANVNIAFTCLDQLDETAKCVENGDLQRIASSDFLSMARKVFEKKLPSVSGIYGAYGLTRREIEKYS